MANCKAEQQIWYPDFVAELDGRFLAGTTISSRWIFSYRLEGTNYFYSFYYDGRVQAAFERLGSADEHIDFPGAALPGQSVNHMLAIAKGQTFALYVNNQPVFYKMREPVWPDGGISLSADGTVALDNFKIWDIADLSSP
jgi:hypothetical protein